MKRALTLLWIALLVAAPARAAGGIGLRWGGCEGTANRNFACDLNTGAEMLVVSFNPPPGIAKLTGVAVYGTVAAANTQFPAWWDLFNRGSCRASSLSALFSLDDLADCEDPWSGQAMGGIAAYRREGNGVRFLLAVAVAPQNAHAVQPGRIYGAMKILVNHQRTTGGGSCTGCNTPVCITVDRIVLGQPNERGLGEVEVTSAMTGLGGAANIVTWQGGTADCRAGAARNSTWGALKRIYR